MSIKSPALIAILALVAHSVSAQEQMPMSAIDWLSEMAASLAVDPEATGPLEAPVADSGLVPEITSTPLGASSADGAGLLPTQITGLPTTLWERSASQDLSALITTLPDRLLPAQQELRYRLLLAVAAPPVNTNGQPTFLIARVQALMTLGAVDQALALLEEAGADTPYLFDYWMNAALLTGAEDAPCDALVAQPSLSEDLKIRIFCLARNGAWTDAALTLQTGRALGDIALEDEELITLFLDPEIAEGAHDLTFDRAPSPLEFRMREAIGQAVSTASLSRAFAAADLRSTTGWKAQLDAAERLAQTGALSANRILGIYTDRQPAASGGVWDRVEAVQRLETAFSVRDPNAISANLSLAWAQISGTGLEATFAQIFAPEIEGIPLSDKAFEVAALIGLSAQDYEGVEVPATLKNAEILRAVAAGDVTGVFGSLPIEAAVIEGFSTANIPDRLQTKIGRGKLGEVILGAMHLLANAQDGDLTGVAPALATLRAIGLEDITRRTALNLLLTQGGT